MYVLPFLAVPLKRSLWFQISDTSVGVLFPHREKSFFRHQEHFPIFVSYLC